MASDQDIEFAKLVAENWPQIKNGFNRDEALLAAEKRVKKEFTTIDPEKQSEIAQMLVGREVSLTQLMISAYGHNLDGWKGRLASAVATAEKLKLKKFPKVEDLEKQFRKEHGFGIWEQMNGVVALYLVLVLGAILALFILGSGDFRRALSEMLQGLL